MTAATVGAMIALAEHAAAGDAVQAVAARLAAGCPQMDHTCQVRALYQYLRRRVLYRGDVHGREHLRHPAQLVAEIEQHGRTSADCDCLAMLGASLALALGLPAWIATDGRDTDGPYEHAYAVVGLPDGMRIPLDTQHRTPFGAWPRAARHKLWAVEEPR